jgi:hypothetical protein
MKFGQYLSIISLLVFLFIAPGVSFSQKSNCISGDCINGYGIFVWGKKSDNLGDRYEGAWENGTMHGEGRYFYANGSVYQGEFVDGKMEGFGSFTWPDGQKYEGQWKANKQHGNGTHVFLDGSSMKGIWENGNFVKKISKVSECISGDCQNGFGVYVWENGEKYEGNWEYKMRHGQGTNYYADGSVYKGDWKSDMQDGYGTLHYANGDRYTGEYKKHKMEGYGSYTFSTGFRYVGDFENGKYNGWGTLFYPDGRTQTGFWENNKFAGSRYNINEFLGQSGCVYGNCQNDFGVFLWENGEYYEGYWKKSHRSGHGRNVYASKSECTGQWKDDKLHGFGVYNYTTGDTYKGQFENNTRKGYGVYYFENGNRYEGYWRDDKYHGEGTFYYEDDSVKSGLWENGSYIGEGNDTYGCVSGDCDDGYGSYVFQSGAKYVGNWDDGKYDGQGTYFAENGDKYIGEFEESQFQGHGTYIFAADGRKYVGEWQNSKYHGFGTMYFANGTSKSGMWKENTFIGEKADKDRKPVITWIKPAYFTTTTTSGSTIVKACIEAGSEIKEAMLYVNGKLYYDNKSRGFKAVLPNCDYTFESFIALNKGENTIEIEVETISGEKTIDSRTINYTGKRKDYRLALVIGNNEYSEAPLKNSVNDAQAMALTLQELGFEVLLYTNIDQYNMKKKIRKFGETLAAQGGIGLFYFAGHGIQLYGENYLVPLKAIIEKEQDVELEAVNLKRVLGEMDYARNEMNIVILDACRNNPFLNNFRSSGATGLASTTAPEGTFIAYATAPGTIASDGTGKHGLYTEELLKAIRIPNQRIEDVFKLVRRNVYQRSGKKQIPWENSSIFTDFYFLED